ncbi:MAG: carbohydrate ABC transporter permease [Treponema sp.]|jgi:ABC-type glycerol-3-phosphate transport system permease component|nr:carbohydrate ABC transporter permease [Treponema sp.]
MAAFSRTQMNPAAFDKSQVKFYAMLAPVVLFMVFPIIYIFSTAFKPMDELFLFPPRFFVRHPTLDNFRRLMEQTKTTIPMSRYFLNSVIVTAVVLAFSLLFSSMAGYALSKIRFRGKKFWFEINQLALMFVPASVAIPKYLVIEKLGIIDTMFAHILPVMAIPVGLFLVKQFIDQVPDSLIEAARIDGANEFSVYLKIVVPIVRPALSTVAILAFQAVWNNMETSQYYINAETLRTFAFYMNTLASSDAGSTVAGQGVNAAATLVMFLPNLIIFIVLQSQVMSTVAHSGIK